MSPLLLLLAAQAAPYNAAPMPDPVLAAERGGFRLPNGVDVALTVETQTAINGVVVLKTVFKADQGAPTLTTFVPRAGTVVSVSGGGSQAGTGTTTPPQISFDARGGIQVTPGVTTIGVSSGQAATSAVQAGLEAVNGTTVTDAGTVTQATVGSLKTVTLDAANLQVTHLAGNAFGSAVANAGSDRVIDTTTSVSIDLANAGPDVVGSAMLRVEDVALSAVGSRLP